MPQLMGRLETLASLHMASSDCVNCMCSPFHNPGLHAAEGLQRNEKIQCDVPVHNATTAKHSKATNPHSGRLVIRERCSKEAR